MGFAPKTAMAERAILTGLVALVLLAALVKVGPELSASFEQIGGIHSVTDPAKAIDHSHDGARASAVLASAEAQEEH
jgi:Flp pilus assembly pilin Flp